MTTTHATINIPPEYAESKKCKRVGLLCGIERLSGVIRKTFIAKKKKREICFIARHKRDNVIRERRVTKFNNKDSKEKMLRHADLLGGIEERSKPCLFKQQKKREICFIARQKRRTTRKREGKMLRHADLLGGIEERSKPTWMVGVEHRRFQRHKAVWITFFSQNENALQDIKYLQCLEGR